MEKRFIVTNHEYMNTGGNCMVSIFAVYDTKENVSRWVIANDEGFSYQTADTVSNCDFQMDCDEIMDKVMIYCHNWFVLTTEQLYNDHICSEEEFELFKYCQFEFYKKDCKYFGNRIKLSVDELPNELFRELSAEYVSWANDTGLGCWTDGYSVFMDDAYEPEYFEPEEYSPHDDLERQLQDIKSFRKWFNDLVGPEASEDDMQKLYEGFITISVAGNSVKLPFDADVFSNVDHVLKRCIEEW